MRTLVLLPFLLCLFSLTWLQDPNQKSEKCCQTQIVENIPFPNEDLNGVYTLKEIGNKPEEICYDGCIYAKDEDEFCFIEKPIQESADITCEVLLNVCLTSFNNLNFST